MNKVKVHAVIIIALGFFLAAEPLHAQWNIGGLFNISNTTFSVDPKPDSEDYSGRFGFGIGGVLDRSITEELSIHAEPMFMQKGGKISESGDEVTFKTSYFELPIMLKYNFQTSKSLTPYAMAGPSIGYLLNAKIKFSDGDEVDAKDELKGADFGFGFGGGVSIPRGKMALFTEARYILGFANINDDSSDGTTVKNRGLQILFGATVPLDR